MKKRFDELKIKVLSLPYKPGIYIMKNKQGEIIYIGKAKALKNRVSQYFQKDVHQNIKTKAMVSNIWDFEVIITKSEFEALILENLMIKKHKPKYNILLKDDKSYPFIKVSTSKPFPDFEIVSSPRQDANRYFGPYASRACAKNAIDTINEILMLKTCKRNFPRDIGKQRPCLNKHMGKCIAPCTGEVSKEDYTKLISEGIDILQSNHRKLLKSLNEQMENCSQNLNFERAALIRDRIKAIQSLTQKQKVTVGFFSDLDAIAFVKEKTKGCVCVLHYLSGNLQDKECIIIDSSFDDDTNEVMESFLKQYYSMRKFVPKSIILSDKIEDEQTLCEFLSSIAQKNVNLNVPKRGKRHDIIELAQRNALEELRIISEREKRNSKSLEVLKEITNIPKFPMIIESYDISNFAGHDTVGCMVVFENGQPKRSKYKKFKINCISNSQDDYLAMSEMLTRRIERFKNGDEKFSPLPDMFLIDGGLGHVRVACSVLKKFEIDIPCFGMVKDEHHRTRGLVSSNGNEFGICTIPLVFSLIGRIQEETHRFAITFNRNLGLKRTKGSILDNIEGVGQKRRNELLKHFKSIEAIKNASVSEIGLIVPKNVAKTIYNFFNKEKYE